MKQTQTQLQAYENIKPKINKMQQLIYALIKLHPNVCREEISIKLHLKLSSVCGRVNELIKKDLIKVSGVKNFNGFRVDILEVT